MTGRTRSHLPCPCPCPWPTPARHFLNPRDNDQVTAQADCTGRNREFDLNRGQAVRETAPHGRIPAISGRMNLE